MTLIGYRLTRKAAQLWEAADEAGELPAYTAIADLKHDPATDDYRLTFRSGAKPRAHRLAASFVRGFLVCVEQVFDEPYSPLEGD